MNKSMSFLRSIAVTVVLCAALTACSTASPKVAYYSLFDADLIANPVHGHETLVIIVGPVTIPDVLNKSRIATGGTDGRYGLSEYHRWTGDVDRDFARALTEKLANGLGTEQVYVFPEAPSAQPNFRVLIDILAMDGDLGKEARLVVRWTLVNPKGEAQSISRRSEFKEQPADGGYDAWVASQRHNINRLGDAIITLIRAAK